MRRFSRPCSGVAKTNADSGGVTLLEESADFCRPSANRDSEADPPRPVRAKAVPEDDAGEPFLRARRRVPVRRGLLPAWVRTPWGKVALGAAVLIAPGVLLALIIAVRSFFNQDPRFRIESSASIQTVGNNQLSRADLLSVFGSDIGRNLFFVPLAKRRAALEQIAWVQRATVMRLLPNQLRVAVVERQPIAFVAIRGHVELVDAAGVILSMTPQQMEARHYSFPVVSGVNPADPLSVRGARMQMYQKFIGELDADGEHLSAQVSEVDLSDPEDVRATVPVHGSDLLLHFGNDAFLARWHNYQAHIAQWEQQYPHLASIDLRYDREVVLKMAGDPGSPAAASPQTGASPSVQTKPALQPAPAAAKITHTAPMQQKTAAHNVKTHKPLTARQSRRSKAHGTDAKHTSRRAA
jgi:cell division protein FtsQ